MVAAECSRFVAVPVVLAETAALGSDTVEQSTLEEVHCPSPRLAKLYLYLQTYGPADSVVEGEPSQKASLTDEVLGLKSFVRDILVLYRTRVQLPARMTVSDLQVPLLENHATVEIQLPDSDPVDTEDLQDFGLAPRLIVSGIVPRVAIVVENQVVVNRAGKQVC